MTSLYQKILGNRFDELPQAVRQLHSVETEVRYSGRCDINRGRGILANLFADILSLPKAGRDVDVKVHLKRDGIKEIWTRYFGVRRFCSVQWQGGDLLYERLRFTTLVFAVEANGKGLSINLRQVYLFGIPALKVLKPQVMAKETGEGEDFHFHILTRLPGLGLLVEYKGALRPDA